MSKVMEAIKNKKNTVVEGLKNKKGFTLMELIVVMAVIAVLTLLAAPRFLGYTKDARVSSLQSDVRVLTDAAFQVNIADEEWPVDDSEARSLAGDGLDISGYALVEEDFGSFVSNISNEFDDYMMVTEGEFEGHVFHVEGEEDKDGNVHFGHDIVVEAD